MMSCAAPALLMSSKPLAAVNRLLMAIHAVLAAGAIGHRAQQVVMASSSSWWPDHHHHVVLGIVMVAAELMLLFIWVLSQAAMWRPVKRQAFPDRLRLPLPELDVMVVTADPDKEPTVEVMNTVMSAMALDYPGDRLTVYLSDDAGSPLTLLAARKAYAFATREWVPFCRKYKLRCASPSSYLLLATTRTGSEEEEERLRIKKLYESLTDDLSLEESKKMKKQSGSSRGTAGTSSSSWTNLDNKADHDAYVEIITDDNNDDKTMPMLVYVSREKRRTFPHHFKAGALNVLLRVSSLMSNSPYILVLDCDMKCNTRSSAMEAMCFHLDPYNKQQQHLGFVQFPQMFHNLSSNDIYANELRYIFATRWKGLDGLRGPILSGTGFYIRRDALYGATPSESHDSTSAGVDEELERRFGRSSDLVASVRRSLMMSNQQLQQESAPPRPRPRPRLRPRSRLQCTDTDDDDLPHHNHHQADTRLLVASCAYEEETGWGQEVGFLYQSVVEDYFTGYRQLFCRGWTSVYCYPLPDGDSAFLGSVPTNLNDVLVQNKRWMAGMLAIGISRHHCPLISRASLSVSVMQSMAFAYHALVALSAFPVLCYGVLMPLCFFRGVPLFVFPPTNNSAGGGGGGGQQQWWFAAALMSSWLQHLIEVSVAKRSLAFRTWWNEQRFWMLNAVTGQLFACVTVFLELIGAGTIDFELTSKTRSDDNSKLYQKGVFDFTGCSTLLLPATTLSVLNVAALVGGTCRNMMITRSGGGLNILLLPQLFLMCYIAALSYPLLEGMFLRRDAARVPARITALSVALTVALLAMFG